MHNKLIAVFIGLALLFGGGTAGVASETSPKETGKAATTPVLTNIGFIKNPPKALKEKFPMCDAFLKVEWIDRGQKIGYSRYDLYRDGKKEKRKAFALIHLDESDPCFDIDLSVYQGAGRIGIEKVFSLIKKGKVSFNNGPSSGIQVDNERTLNFKSIGGTREIWNLTFADNKINVCIPYPDNQIMWIAESKRIYKIYSKEETFKIFAKLKDYVSFPPQVLGVGDKYIIDLNFDSIEDYFSPVSIFYSYGNKYYEMKPLWVRELDEEFGQWSFPPTQRKCELSNWMGPIFLTTNGKSFFLNNQCNLTELTRSGEE